MRRRLGIILTVFLLSLSTTSTLFASGVSESTESNTKALEQKQGEQVKSLDEPVAPTAVYGTIAATFPDVNLAKLVANKVSGGNVNTILTQDMVDGLTSLTWYWMWYGDIQDITGIEILTGLEYLNLSGTQITNIPEGIGNLSNLQYLYLSGNQITSIPESIGNLSNLQELDLSYNQPTSIPESIGNLSKLEHLDLSENQLTSIPASIGNLSSLKTLILGYDDSVHAPAPDNMGFALTSNQLASIPASIGNLSSLEVLLLGENQLTSLPESIGNLRSLQYLDLRYNQLESLPASIGNLSSLELLILHENQLTSLPESIGGLSVLWGLTLENNQLTSLPESIGDLISLDWLNLNYNQLTSLPESISDLSSLRHLNLSNNLLPTDYDEVLNTVGLNISINYEQQRQLVLLTGLNPYTILKGSDLDNINLFDIVELDEGSAASTGHNLILENYVDEDGTPVDLSDYLKNGIVIKDGKVFAQERATGAGLFSSGSDHAITTGKIQLNFETTYYDLLFELNGGKGTCPDAQVLLEGAVGTAVNSPVREGFSFKGWNTAQDGRGSNWIPGTTPMVGDNVTLYAQWEENVNPITPVPPNIIKLPKTGNNGIVLLGVVLLSLGGLLVVRKFKKTV